MALYPGNTRAGLAIRAGRKIKRICGVITVEANPPRILADGRCCGMAYATEYISSVGASVHVWLGDADAADAGALEKVVDTLIYWKDAAVITWSSGNPLGYRTYHLLGARINHGAMTEQVHAGTGTH